jgi:NAD(P)-dependent dehydrogenase (short-subunit alcohol dehydrogenase family)
MSDDRNDMTEELPHGVVRPEVKPAKDGPMKTVVVGASSGLGRSIAIGLGRQGSEVALLARRHDALVEAAKEIGPHAVAIACDVTDERSCAAAIEEAAAALGGIDALVYTTGIGRLARLVEVSATQWREVFDTNVIGASLVTAAALPHLTASSGAAVYLSSVSASLTPPWPGLGSYAVSKAALEKLVEAWRAEHPHVGFTRMTIGECMGGEGPSQSSFATGWDADLAGELVGVWFTRQYMSGSFVDVDELVRVLENVLRCGASASIPTIALIPRPPA